MTNNSSVTHQGAYIWKGIIQGVIIGGLVGIVFGFLNTTGVLIIPGLNTVFSAIPLNQIITGTLLGIIIGALMSGVWTLYSTENVNAEYIPETKAPKENIYDNSKSVTLQIKEEQFDVSKKWIQTGDVKIYRETFTEEKNFTVPIRREELVIEKKVIPSITTEQNDAAPEVIRIPLNKEQVEFTKHKVDLENVSIYKQQIEDIKHIEETLKREECKVKISGSPRIKDESNSNNS